LTSVAEALARNPWQQRFPLGLQQAIPVTRGGRWFVRDAASREAPLRVAEDDGWQLLALSGGQALSIFGEWLGDRWRPLSAWVAQGGTPCWTEVTGLS
jgi:hypothetical protein